MNKIFKFFSAFIVLLMGFTGCDTIVETSSVQPKSPKQSQQVIIEESTPSKPNTEQTQQQTQQQNQIQNKHNSKHNNKTSTKQKYNSSNKIKIKMKNKLQKCQKKQNTKLLLLQQKKRNLPLF
ncbi:hypothetical protein [Clostridium sp. MD294]|uniref:hypothetical protein n=1 Tax=Clostridium sp. MD294 TaxID=97138 RepID=UPI002073E896|nr:hypothetical protein [Clostridium sp. MD294]